MGCCLNSETAIKVIKVIFWKYILTFLFTFKKHANKHPQITKNTREKTFADQLMITGILNDNKNATISTAPE